MDKDTKKHEHVKPDWLLKKQRDENAVTLIKIDEEKERNAVSFEDALLFNSNDIKRGILLEYLKTDSIENIEFLEKALNDEDTETAHYAATALLGIKQKLFNSAQSLQARLDQNPNDTETLMAYANVIKKSIELEKIDDMIKRRYSYQYSLLLQKLIEIEPQQKSHYIKKINCDLELGEYDTAFAYIKQFISFFPNDEAGYFLKMKLHFQMKNKEQFYETIYQLRRSSIVLSPEGLNKLRFWLQR
ncbi:hypothetical protein [Bacillus sp. Marseille-P3661]|uniref:hypothetical protein n=1 Tax=Bacillus sp. Marseille-P3661 TaxID=1936234 RepID=UPI0015E19AF7|nr:hypothetical protein [Bacillus sp. Marseille-P3661]